MPEGVGYPEDQAMMDAGAQGAGPGSPDAVMEADAEMADAQRGMMGAAAPPPEKPFSVKAIKTLISQFNDTVEAFAGDELPDVEWEPMEKGAKWDQPLPQEIYVPITALSDALGVIAGGEFAEKYSDFSPMEIVDDPTLRKATAKLRQMEKDKKLVAAMSEPLEQAAEAEPMSAEEGPVPPAPSEMTEEDQALQESMA